MNIQEYNTIRNMSSYEQFSNLFCKFSENKRKFGHDFAVSEIRKHMPNVLYLTEGSWSNKYVDCPLNTIYQDFHDKIIELKNQSNEQIYEIKTDIFKSDMNLWHKIWKIVVK
nr:MAG TPA_asm: hypothetical protein [Caudoviricetes sp.]